MRQDLACFSRRPCVGFCIPKGTNDEKTVRIAWACDKPKRADIAPHLLPVWRLPRGCGYHWYHAVAYHGLYVIDV